VEVVQAEVADLVERLVGRPPRREGQAKEGS
jgi:hypothetical protein